MPLPAHHTHILELATSGLGLVPARERADAEQLLALLGAHFVDGVADPGTYKRQLGQLVEVLARRSAQAMPYAALGRAMLADLHGDTALVGSLMDEFAIKMSQLGL